MQNPYGYENNQSPTLYQENMDPSGGKKRKRNRGGGIGKKLATGLLVVMLAFGGGLGGGYAAYQIWGQDVAQDGNLNLNYGNNASATPTSADVDGGLTGAQVSEMAGDSVVEVATEQVSNDAFFRQYVQEGAGSGVTLTADGYIVTNNHVIEGASKITIRLKNGETYEAKLMGTDDETDIALLKIEATGLTPAVIGNSDELKVGDKAYVIGNPLGTLGGTVTQGIVSALNRNIDVDGKSMNLLQTDAAVNPGNSGGALINSQGQLVGIIVAKSAGSNVEGLGFAIPINDVTDVVEQLNQYGYVKGRISLGMTLVDIGDEQTAMMYGVRQLGTYVLKVEENSSAQRAGLQRGDRILSIDNKEITGSADISALVKEKSVGDTVQVTVNRNGQERTLTLTMEESVPSSLTT
ncbi:trypsin-like peptidase domain-containing protein [Eubacteriales bacterium OttesenSCG-928-M02]|nr:trypsin-like peptidase domain-containing protein [Eubacteriales bacterium OttesenSCG-928-M02]